MEQMATGGTPVRSADPPQRPETHVTRGARQAPGELGAEHGGRAFGHREHDGAERLGVESWHRSTGADANDWNDQDADAITGAFARAAAAVPRLWRWGLSVRRRGIHAVERRSRRRTRPEG